MRSWWLILYAAPQPRIGHNFAMGDRMSWDDESEEQPVAPDLVPLIEAFRAHLLACLEECAQGRRGLFTDREHIDP